jgi:LmbE family N-acetylglucosaminyl deacetylase
VELHVPDGVPIDLAMRRTTDLGIGAHPDDLEFDCLVAIGECRDHPDRWFTGVTCTDGAGSARGGRFAQHTDSEMAEVRRAEQRQAADVGGYSAVVQLGHSSRSIGDAGGVAALGAELVPILAATRPINLYTHNPADEHPTHLAVVAATVGAVRALPIEQRPVRFVGIEGWRDLDWLGDGEKLRFDATPHAELAQQLAAVFESQLDGAKRYDVATRGRRQANATFSGIRSIDDAEEVIVAMDLTPLLRNDDLDLVDYVTSAVDRFRSDVEGGLRRVWPSPHDKTGD